MEVKNICCIGAGYVGGPTMAVIALKCPQIKVTVVDINQERINKWNGPLDQLPVYEPGLSDVVKQTRNKNLFFTTEIDKAIHDSEMIFMAVNTPTKKEGEGAGMAADLRYFESSARHIARVAKNDKIIVEKSTLPVRTAEKIKEILLKEGNGVHFEILSNPEFLAEGTAIQDLFKSDRVLIGGDQTETGQKAVKKLVNIYKNWIPENKILTTNVWSSELAKLASNAMLAQRVSSINSLSALCDKTGADVDELSKAIGMDHRIGPNFLKASVGFGGSCFQKDILNLVYLCNFYGLEEVAEFWHQVVKINNYQKDRFFKILFKKLEYDIVNKKIGLLGWSFKGNTNDSRESPSIYFAINILKNGGILYIHDPKIEIEQIQKDISEYSNQLKVNLPNFEKNIYLIKDLLKCIESSEVIAILTDNDIYKKIRTSKTIFDGRRIIQKELRTNNYFSI